VNNANKRCSALGSNRAQNPQLGEREIVKLRYGLGDGYSYTLEEVGHIFKVTRERVRQIEAKAVRKLQQPSRRFCARCGLAHGCALVASC
jgi:hypothetical protein